VLLRIGPWCHGEVLNGGFPNRLQKMGDDKVFELRRDNPGYLGYVTRLYAQIAEQMKGLMWKDGGPVIAIQVENEYSGPTKHLMTLTKMARDAGIDVPLYTCTGMSAPLTVFALRCDGFTSAMNLELKDAPEGFSLSGARVLENQDKAQFTLKAPPELSKKPVAMAIEGYAMIAGKLVRHTAVPAEDMMQAFAYRHMVPSKELAVTVNGPPRLFMPDAFKIISATPRENSRRRNGQCPDYHSFRRVCKPLRS